MSAVKEYMEFFLRDTKVNTGDKADQQTNYPVEYLVNGKVENNRFLKNHVPSEGIFRKLFASIPFFLNKESTATTTTQGLVKVANDVNASERTSEVENEMRSVIEPHQLPDVVNQVIVSASITGDISNGNPTIINISDVDILKFSIGGVVSGTGIAVGSKIVSIDYDNNEIELSLSCTATASGVNINQAAQDSSVSTFTFAGTSITTFIRTIEGRLRRNFRVLVARQNSIIVDKATQRLQLDGDILAPGNYKHYGTDSAGVKGWYGGNYIQANQTTTVGAASNGNFCSTTITDLTAGEYEVNFSGNIQCTGNNQNLKIIMEFQKNGASGRIIAHNSPPVVGEQLYTTLSAFTRVSVVDGDVLRVNVANQGTDIISADVYMDLKKII